MIDSGFREGLTLQLTKDPKDTGSGPDHIDFREIAIDGLATSAVRRTSTIEMFPGYRSDVLVKAPSQAGVYYLIDARRKINTLLGQAESLKFIAKVVIRDAAALDMKLPTDDQVLAQRLPRLPEPDPSTPVQYAYFGVSRGFVIGTEDPGPNGAVSGSEYDPTMARSLPLGAVQRWRIGTRNDYNAVGEAPPPPPRGPAHPFHIHVNPFEIVSIKDFNGVEQLAAGERVYRDTISMPPGYTIEFLTRYADFPGSFVLHCHILDHEDRGMMEKLTIRSPGPAKERRQKVSAPPRNRVSRTIPAADGKPSVLFFVLGPACPHCMTQLNDMASQLAGRRVQVVVVSASSEADLQKFPAMPFVFVPDPDSKFFKLYRAWDGKPRHATIVRDRQGKELLRKITDEPFLKTAEVLAAVNRASPR
jgi:peroxiredoxin